MSSRKATIELLDRRVLAAAHVVKDLPTGLTTIDSYRSAVEMNGWLYYWANAGSVGSLYEYELWRTRGTPGQTHQVAVVQSIPSQSAPDLVTMNHHLYFRAFSESSGDELWSSDGTSQGTSLIADCLPGSASSTPRDLVSTDNLVFFTARLPSGTQGLYRTDGTESGTFAVSQSSEYVLDSLIPFGDKLIFGARNSATGSEPWVSDGTMTGTIQLGDLAPGTANSRYDDFWYQFVYGSQLLGSKLYFTAAGQIYSTDGTSTGTSAVTSFPVNSIYDDTTLTRFQNRLYFPVGKNTWSTDGVTSQLAITGKGFNSLSTVMTPTKMVFISGPPTGIYTGNGTTAGTSFLRSLANTGIRVGDLPVTANLGETAFLAAADASNNVELWTSDGSVAGTLPVADIFAGSTSSRPGNFVVFNNDLYFLATSNATGRDLWRVDITPPELVDGSLQVDAPAQSVAIQFNDDVSTSLNSNHVSIACRDDNSVISPSSIQFSSYDALLRTGSFTFTSLPGSILADGNYRATVANVTDYAGNTMVGDATFDFFFLQADATRDRIVDTQDFNQLAGRFGQTGAVFSQGDFNYDQAVTSSDFNILVSQFGKRLAEPVPGVSPTSITVPSLFATGNEDDAGDDDGLLS